MEAPTLKSHIREYIEESKKMYLEDLEPMTDEQLAKSPGGKARTPFDYTYECILINNRIATRLSGGDPGKMDFNGWIKAPADFNSKDRALKELSESTDAVIAAWDKVPDGEVGKKIVLPTGETTPLELANLVARHMGYHDAQLNLHQTIQGDDEMHWKF